MTQKKVRDAKHLSQALMSATPGADEVAGQAVMTALRHNLTQLEDTFELARIGLRHSSELKRTVTRIL